MGRRLITESTPLLGKCPSASEGDEGRKVGDLHGLFSSRRERAFVKV
jgi:hypothetical protein